VRWFDFMSITPSGDPHKIRVAVQAKFSGEIIDTNCRVRESSQS
jgi:hypothetical protein